MKAVPINSSGETIGPAKFFTETQWERMKRTVKSSRHFAWKQVDDNYQPAQGKELMPIVSTKEAKSAPIKQEEIFDGNIASETYIPETNKPLSKKQKRELERKNKEQKQ